MAEATAAVPRKDSRRKTQIGEVVSARMRKTIVVVVQRKRQHSMYARVIARSKKFYAHDEQGQARVGDVVRIEETRPLSKLKPWRLLEVVRRAALVPSEETIEEQAI